VRSLFYRLAMIGGQGGLVMAVGYLADGQGDIVLAWQQVFGALALLLLAAGAWHALALPRPALDTTAPARRPPAQGAAPALGAAAWQVFSRFFRRSDIVAVLAFLLLYRLAEAQLLKLATPFLLDARTAGGLGLDNTGVGLAYGTVGVAALTVGGLLGGWVVSRLGLRRALWPLMLCLHLPNLVYVALAAWQPEGLGPVTLAVGLEQFGYGLGFTVYMVFMLMVAERRPDGPDKTAHYALCTGFMALGMMLPGMAAGWLQEHLGYTAFFVWVCVATLPSLAAAARLRIDPAFGRRD
jgi:PAT family beta-lactamase induction signal transducer AmpG